MSCNLVGGFARSSRLMAVKSVVKIKYAPARKSTPSSSNKVYRWAHGQTKSLLEESLMIRWDMDLVVCPQWAEEPCSRSSAWWGGSIMAWSRFTASGTQKWMELWRTSEFFGRTSVHQNLRHNWVFVDGDWTEYQFRQSWDISMAPASVPVRSVIVTRCSLKVSNDFPSQQNVIRREDDEVTRPDKITNLKSSNYLQVREISSTHRYSC